MTLTIEIPKDQEAGIRDASARHDWKRLREILGEIAAPALLTLLEQDPLENALARLQQRTPEEIARLHAEALATVTPPQRALPEGKTLAEALAGTWPGDESDAEVAHALQKLS